MKQMELLAPAGNAAAALAAFDAGADAVYAGLARFNARERSENFTPEQRDFFYKSLISISEKLEKYYNELPKHDGQDGE